MYTLHYAALRFSCRPVAIEVTSDSKFCPAGAMQFDSNINGVYAFASGGEQLVATTHADKTVRLWRDLATATHSGAIALQQCCGVVSEIWVNQIVCAELRTRDFSCRVKATECSSTEWTAAASARPLRSQNSK